MANFVLRHNSKQNYIFYWYYPIMIMVYMLPIFLPFIRTGITMSLFLMYLWYRVKLIRNNTTILFLFLLYVACSIVGYLYNGLPLTPYFSEISSFLLPTVFYFVFYSYKIDRAQFYDNLLNSIIICFILGLICFVLSPSQYIQYIVKIADSSYQGQVEGEALYIRFQSFFGSTVTGTLGVVGTAILLDKFRNNILKSIGYKIWYIIGYFVLFVGTMLSSQRSAMVCELAVVAYYLLESLFFNKKRDICFLLINVIVIMMTSGYLMNEYSDKINYMLERIFSVEEGLSGRDIQWKQTFENSYNIITGTGLGSAGLYARPYTKYFISDGALFKMIAEFGVIGFFLFATAILSLLLKNLKYLKWSFIEFSIIVVYILQSTASNTLYFQQLLPIFWFAVGMLSTKQYLNNQWK